MYAKATSINVTISEKNKPTKSRRYKHRPQPETLQVAAATVQRAWRSYMCRRIFKYLKIRINQYYQLEPKKALRTVNPREAELLDSGSGLYVNFRLGGETFPPSVFYKISTFNPLVELCTNTAAPDVTEDEGKDGEQPPEQEERLEWLQPMDNNDWRLFCAKVVCNKDHVVMEANKKWYSSENVNKFRKRRKIEQLRKMYEEGRLQDLSHQVREQALVDAAVQKEKQPLEEEEDEDILKYELDELQAWVNIYNCEEVMDDLVFLP